MSILLYTDAANLQQRDLNALRKAGYVPVRVDDPSAVKFIDAPAISPAEQSMILIAALKGVSTYTESQRVFGISLAKMLIESHLAALPDADRPKVPS